MYTFEQLKEDVRKEAEALRIHATKEERERLKIEKLNPTHMDYCIYGQMTGNCFSERAAILIDMCCSRFFKNDAMPGIFSPEKSLDRVLRNVNGTSVHEFVKERVGVSEDAHYSAIEAYILLPDAKNANLISYLRGETETLEL